MQTDLEANAVRGSLWNCWDPLLAIDSASEEYVSRKSSIR